MTVQEESVDARLPRPSAAMKEVLDGLDDRTVSMRLLTQRIARDRGISTWLRGVVEHSLLGNGRTGLQTPQAVAAIPKRELRAWCVAYNVRQLARRLPLDQAVRDAAWADGVRRAIAARILAERTGFESPNEAAAIAWILDVGFLLLGTLSSDHVGALADLQRSPHGLRRDEENRLFGVDHTRVIARVVEPWSIPEDIARLIALHHTVDEAGGARLQQLVRVLAAADAVADVFSADAHPDALEHAREWLARLDVRGAPLALGELGAELERLGPELAPLLDATWKAREDLLPIIAREEGEEPPPTPEETIKDLERQVRQITRERDELQRMLQRIAAEGKQSASLDPLTSAVTRVKLLDEARELLTRCQARSWPLSILLLDVDGLAQINHAFGLDAGDKVLRQVAVRVGSVFRSVDVLGRIGGGSFAVLLPRIPADGGMVAARRARHVLSLTPVELGPDQTARVTASFGGAVYTGEGTADLDTLVLKAENALLEAKEQGGDRVIWRR